MVDDLACVSTCGLDTVKTNAFINAKTSLKKLQFGPDKCQKMHVGKNTPYCPELGIDSWKTNIETKTGENIDEFDGDVLMEESEEEKYLGDMITRDGMKKKNIGARKGKGYGIVERIIDMLHVAGDFIWSQLL